MTNKLFILGAGASKPANVPLLKDFICEGIFHLQHGTAFPDSLDYYRYLPKYLKTEFNYDFNNDDCYLLEDKTDIEKLISELDHRIRNSPNDKLIKAREEAVRFVFLTLENAVKDGSQHNCYPDFVKNKINLKEGNYTIITFNYETLLEKALLHSSLGGSFSYELDIDANRIEHFPSYERNFDKSLLILKLHGSLNWAECQNCNKNQLVWFNQYDRIFKEKCNKCDKNLTPILIPPTQSKYLKEPLANLWKIAEDKIIHADEITIIGYSFNDYDVTALSLILDSTKKNKRYPTLNIVDSDPHNIRKKILSRALIDEKDFKEIHLFKEFRNYLKDISIQ